MKKICLVVGNTLPVPAVMGGAVEELIKMLLDQNEIEQKAEFIIFSRENKKAEREAYLLILLFTLSRTVSSGI